MYIEHVLGVLPSEVYAEYGLGYLPDPVRLEDYTPQHAVVKPLVKALGAKAPAPKALVAKQDLRQWFSPVETQGALGACTVHATVALLEYFEQRATGKYLDASRLFLYKTGRNLLGWTGDRGMFLRTAMQALALLGVPPESFWPYDGSAAASNQRYELEPTALCYALAANYKAITYFRLDRPGWKQQTLDAMRTYIAAGVPSMFGLPAYSELMSPLPGGLVGYPSATSKYYGAHAVVAAGYDDDLMIGADKGALLIRNSWGAGWGDWGYGWLSYRYVLNGVTSDHWAMLRANWIDTGIFGW